MVHLIDREKALVLTRVHVLVHPFFSLAHLGEDAYRVRRKNIDFLLGLWGKKIIETAADPQAALVWVHADGIVHPTPGLPAWQKVFLPRYEKLVRFANSKLGNRLLVLFDKVNVLTLRKKMAEQGIRFSPGTKGSSFGEWWNQCVWAESRATERALQLDHGVIKGERGYSLSDFPGKNALGSFEQNLRSQARRLKRRSPMARSPRLRK